MPLPLIPALIGALGAAAVSLTGRVLIALGIGYVSYTGISVGIDTIINAIKSNMAGMGVETVRFLSYLWVDKAFSMYFAAWSIALTLKLAGATSIKKMIVK